MDCCRFELIEMFGRFHSSQIYRSWPDVVFLDHLTRQFCFFAAMSVMEASRRWKLPFWKRRQYYFSICLFPSGPIFARRCFLCFLCHSLPHQSPLADLSFGAISDALGKCEFFVGALGGWWVGGVGAPPGVLHGRHTPILPGISPHRAPGRLRLSDSAWGHWSTSRAMHGA